MPLANQVPTLVRKELLSHLLTLRLVVALVFTVVLCLLTTVMGSLDYSRNVRAYEKAVDAQRQGLAGRWYPFFRWGPVRSKVPKLEEIPVWVGMKPPWWAP